jgi:GNAT superfamily N-acetyltransferase
MYFDLYSPRWHSDTIQLANEIFGEGYFVRPSEIAAEPGSVIVISQEENETLLGFAQGRVLRQGALQDYLERDMADIPPDIADADRKGALGVIQAIAVAPEHRRCGHGTKLIELLHDRLIGLGADKLIVTFKRGPGAAHVDGIMSRLGFETWQRLPSYWQARCDASEFQCIDRRSGCTCEALLYRKAIY